MSPELVSPYKHRAATMNALDPVRIVFLDRATLPRDVSLEPLGFPHRMVEYDQTSSAQVAERIAEADIAITNKVGISADDLSAAERLKLIAIAATGADMIDLDACARRRVLVSNVRKYAENSVPEHVFALIFALRRQIVPYGRSISERAWERAGQFCYFDYPISELRGTVLGIIGAGTLGRAVGRIGAALGMKVLFASRKGQEAKNEFYAPFHEVLMRSDVISLHVPLNTETRHMLSYNEFASMERRPLIINTSRGGLIEEKALVKAIIEGQISGAGLDVVSTEPPPANHPYFTLLDRPNFILTPHVAWASREAIVTLTRQLRENLELWYAGKPRHLLGTGENGA